MKPIEVPAPTPEGLAELDGPYRTTRDARLRTRARMVLLAAAAIAGIVLSRPQHTISSPDPEYALKKRRSKGRATGSRPVTSSITPRRG